MLILSSYPNYLLLKYDYMINTGFELIEFAESISGPDPC